MTPLRVLVVDDSATMRALIRRVLARDPGIEVVGDAADAEAARSAIKILNPDVVTLDIELPGMNGLDFLERLMRLRPMPVVMVSTLTSRGAEATLRALELGAVDCVAKPNVASPDSFDCLPQVVRGAGAARHFQWRPPVSVADRPVRPKSYSSLSSRIRLVALAASTGGVDALLRVFSGLPENGPPVAVVQHMPSLFTSSFAKRLDRQSAVEVQEATDGVILKPGLAVLAPGGNRHLEVVEGPDGSLRCRLTVAPPVNGHSPSADPLFHSAARVAGDRAVGVILTGMGADGASGLLAMRQAGAHTIGQDEATCAVYGMPAAAKRLGALTEQLPIDLIAAAIVGAAAAQQGKRTTDHAVRKSS